MLVVWKLDRLGRNLAHLVITVQDLSARGVGLRVLAGQGAHRHPYRGRSPRVRHLRGAGGVRAGVDPRTHRGRAQGRTGPRAQGAGRSSRLSKAQESAPQEFAEPRRFLPLDRADVTQQVGVEREVRARRPSVRSPRACSRRPAPRRGAARPWAGPAAPSPAVAARTCTAARTRSSGLGELPPSTCCHTFRATGIIVLLAKRRWRGILGSFRLR